MTGIVVDSRVVIKMPAVVTALDERTWFEQLQAIGRQTVERVEKGAVVVE